MGNSEFEDPEYAKEKKEYADQVMIIVERRRAELQQIPETEETQELRKRYQLSIDGLLKIAEHGPVRCTKIHSTFGRLPLEFRNIIR